MKIHSNSLHVISDPDAGPRPYLRRLPSLVDSRIVYISVVAVLIAFLSALVAQALTRLIGLITHIAYFGETSTDLVAPAGHHLGVFAVAVPVVGGIIVGLMARYGSKAIRGHGIPEAMEQVLLNQSRIPPRLTFLKPLSAAIAIGTGGPFGAEGPIIATGGSLGSLVGQLLRTTARERKILLASGAAAGMAATFGSPISAVILALELLLFEISPRSIIPVSLASATATGVRIAFVGATPIFAMPDVGVAGGMALVVYALLGSVVGLCAVYVTKGVYLIEDLFELLPIHWMWWPALGGIAVGLIGLIDPNTLGVGYENIQHILSGTIAGKALVVFFTLKLCSWAIALGSGTSGGTLAPLFTIGGGIGSALSSVVDSLFPSLGVDPRVGALVGMAAIFAGASRAPLASVIFAFETTLQPMGILPLLLGCTLSFLVSCLSMKHSIMTEKIARRGVRVPTEYLADSLDSVLVREVSTKEVVTLFADQSLDSVRQWLNSAQAGSEHQGFPVVDGENKVLGVVTKRGLAEAAASGKCLVREAILRLPVFIQEDCSLREAMDHMIVEGVNRLVVTEESNPSRVTGILSRSDLFTRHRTLIEDHHRSEKSIHLRSLRPSFLHRKGHKAKEIHSS
jgi:chloride channel protein, CIC family